MCVIEKSAEVGGGGGRGGGGGGGGWGRGGGGGGGGGPLVHTPLALTGIVSSINPLA